MILWPKVCPTSKLPRNERRDLTRYSNVLTIMSTLIFTSIPVDPLQSLIVVRPPPSKTNHPLNLQVQLISPSSRSKERARSSFDASADPGDDIIVPTSASSSQWDVSTAGYSTVSLSSNSSVFSPSTKRTITPLYNLQAHNVLTNVIIEAATDAKVGKFHKNGVEIVGLAILEPVEIWPGASLSAASGKAFSGESEETSSAASLTSHTQPSQEPHHNVPGSSSREIRPRITSQQPINEPSTKGGVRKFFGKVFKKTTETSPGSRRRVSPLAPETRSEPSPSSVISTRRTLGVTPTVESPAYPPRGKYPKSYTWTVRRWLKYEADETSSVDVRFEWKRAKVKGKDRVEGTRRRTEEHDRSKSRERTANSAPPASRQQFPMAASPHRQSFELDDPEDESDTEDSDTPWICTLVCNRQGSSVPPSLPRTSTQHNSPHETRLRVGSVVPAPHHPKIAAMLKIPSPLPDIDMATGTVHKRSPKAVNDPSGSRPSTPSLQPDFPVYSWSAFGSLLSSLHDVSIPLILTGQEIKDIVSCTGIWLIVREGFGGVGIDRRKGDGWQIRG